MDFWATLDVTNKIIVSVAGLVGSLAILVPLFRALWRKGKKYRERMDWIMNDKYDHELIKAQLNDLSDGLSKLASQFEEQFQENNGSSFKDALNRFEGKIDYLSSFMRTSFHTHTKAIFETDKEGRVTYVNRAYMRMTGYSQQEVLGMGWVNLIPQGERSNVVESFMHAVRAQRDYDEFLTLRHAEGYTFKVHALAYAIHTNGECALGHFGEITLLND